MCCRKCGNPVKRFFLHDGRMYVGVDWYLCPTCKEPKHLNAVKPMEQIEFKRYRDSRAIASLR